MEKQDLASIALSVIGLILVQVCMWDRRRKLRRRRHTRLRLD